MFGEEFEYDVVTPKTGHPRGTVSFTLDGMPAQCGMDIISCLQICPISPRFKLPLFRDFFKLISTRPTQYKFMNTGFARGIEDDLFKGEDGNPTVARYLLSDAYNSHYDTSLFGHMFGEPVGPALHNPNSKNLINAWYIDVISPVKVKLPPDYE